MHKTHKDDWKRKAIVAPKPLAYDKVLTSHEYGALSYGLRPLEMEDKWFIYLDGDTLNLHRSWTGHQIYQATIKKVEDQDRYDFETVLVETDLDRHKLDSPDAARDVFSSLIEHLISRTL